MAEFQAFSARVLVNGQTVLAVMKGMGAFSQTALQILARHGIQSPEPNGWYAQQAYVAGGLAGALRGIQAWPADWVTTVETAVLTDPYTVDKHTARLVAVSSVHSEREVP